MMYFIQNVLTNMFRPVYQTDDTHHLHSGLELTTLVITPRTLNSLNSNDFNNYPFLAYILILLK
jgi:hypothetical protein